MEYDNNNASKQFESYRDRKIFIPRVHCEKESFPSKKAAVNELHRIKAKKEKRKRNH